MINQNRKNSSKDARITCQIKLKPGPVNKTPKVITQRMIKARMKRVLELSFDFIALRNFREELIGQRVS